MMTKHWYTDPTAEATFKEVQRRIEPQIAGLFPDYAMTHMGIKRVDNFESKLNEVQIVIHLRPLGEAWEINERLEAMKVGRTPRLENTHD